MHEDGDVTKSNSALPGIDRPSCTFVDQSPRGGVSPRTSRVCERNPTSPEIHTELISPKALTRPTILGVPLRFISLPVVTRDSLSLGIVTLELLWVL